MAMALRHTYFILGAGVPLEQTCPKQAGALQQARSFGTLDRASTAVAYQLPQVVGCTAGPREVSTIDPGQACLSSDGQYSDSCLYKLPGWCSLTSRQNSNTISSFRGRCATEVCYWVSDFILTGEVVIPLYSQGVHGCDCSISRLNPQRPYLIPSWNLSSVLLALQRALLSSVPFLGRCPS